MRIRLATGLALAFVIGLGACTSGRDVARLENPKAVASPGAITFGGVLERPGRSSAPGATRYVFHTHGMGLTNADQDLIAPLKAAFGLAGYALVETTGWQDSPTEAPHAFIGEALPCPPGATRNPALGAGRQVPGRAGSRSRSSMKASAMSLPIWGLRENRSDRA